MATIQLELARDDTETLQVLQTAESEPIVVATPDHFEGGAEIISAVVTLTATSLPFIASIIKEHIRSKRYIKVKVKGVEIVGAVLTRSKIFLGH